MYLAGLLKAAADTEIVAACDVYEPRRLEAVAKMGPQTKAVADYREVLYAKDIDAVVIGSPDHWHTPMVLDAVAAGKEAARTSHLANAAMRQQKVLTSLPS